MRKIAHYLQEHLNGEISLSPEARHQLSRDASILQLTPAFVVYPRDEQDIRKSLRFSWQLAERGRNLPITARGGGSDTSGAAIGSGAVMIMPTHMNRILELDPKKQTVTIEPGITYDKLEQVLYTHELFLPPYPASFAYATVGGGIANNAIGEKSLKYGDTLKYLKNLRVVLANGEVIETGPLSKRDLSYKMGLSTFEGQVYRSLDTLLEESSELVGRLASASEANHNSIGYKLANIKHKGEFDLTPLFVGSQGTLGIISEATFKIVPYNQKSILALVGLNSLDDFAQILPDILKLKPSIFDMINKTALDEVLALNPKQLTGNLISPKAQIHLFLEFDDAKNATRQQKIKDLGKLVDKVGGDYFGSETNEEKQRIIKIRHSVNTLLVPPRGPKKAVPVAEDVALPLPRLVEYLKAAENIFTANLMPAAMWGNVGSGVVRMHPMLDLSQLGDRQKFFVLSESLYSLAISMKGSLSAAAGEGRVRAPYVRQLYGEEFFGLIQSVKSIFDPHNMLNPGVKTASQDDVKSLMATGYSLAHRHEHLPRS